MIWIPCLPNTGDSDPIASGDEPTPLTQACRNLTLLCVYIVHDHVKGALEANDPEWAKRELVIFPSHVADSADDIDEMITVAHRAGFDIICVAVLLDTDRRARLADIWEEDWDERWTLTTGKRGLSALLLQRQLALRRYETAWMLLHKFRRAMVKLTREPLQGEVEVDDTWVGGTQAGLRGSRQLKGRKAALVLVAVEKRGRGTGRARMEVIPDFKSITLIAFLKRNVAPSSKVYTDGLKSFTGLQEAGFKHAPRSQPLQH
jgi:transposase-like protein